MKEIADMTVQELWDGGYAVAVFSPEEMSGADPDHVAEIMIERGWNAIDTLGN